MVISILQLIALDGCISFVGMHGLKLSLDHLVRFGKNLSAAEFCRTAHQLHTVSNDERGLVQGLVLWAATPNTHAVGAVAGNALARQSGA